MKFCPECGTQLDDKAAFCGNCGTSTLNGLQAGNAAGQPPVVPQNSQMQPVQPVYTTTQVPPQMQAPYGQGMGVQPTQKSKKPLMIALMAVVAVALVIGIFFAVRAFMGGGSQKVVEKDFIGIQTAFLQDRFGGIGAIASKGSFSTDITISGSFVSSDPDMQNINQLLQSSAAIFKIDAKKKEWLYNVIVNLQGSNILEADFIMSEKEIGFAVPAADSNYYIGDIRTIMQNFGASEQEINSLLKSFSATGFGSADAFVNAFKTVLGAGINENSLTIAKKASVSLDKLGETLNGTLYVWQPTAEDWKAILEKLADEMENGVALGGLLKRMEDMGADFTVGDGRFESVEDMIRTIRINSDRYGQEMADGGFRWEMATDSDGKVSMVKLIFRDVEMGYQGVVTDENVKEQFYVASDGNTQMRVDNEADVSGKIWSGTLSLSTAYGAFPIRYNLDTYKYSALGLPYGTVSFSLAPLVGMDVSMEIVTQAGKSGSSDMTINLSGVSDLTYGMMDSMQFIVNATDESSASKPSGDKVDISNYTEEDFAELFNSIVTNIGYSLLSSPALRDLMFLFY